MTASDEWAEEARNPMLDCANQINRRGQEMATDSVTPDPHGTDEQKLAWCKERAAAESWEHAIASIISDMSKTGIPLNPDLYYLAMGEAMIGGERGVRQFIDGITLASVARREEAADHG